MKDTDIGWFRVEGLDIKTNVNGGFSVLAVFGRWEK